MGEGLGEGFFPRRHVAQASGGKVKEREDVYGAVYHRPVDRLSKRFISMVAGKGGTLFQSALVRVTAGAVGLERGKTESIMPSAYSSWAVWWWVPSRTLPIGHWTQ